MQPVRTKSRRNRVVIGSALLAACGLMTALLFALLFFSVEFSISTSGTCGDRSVSATADSLGISGQFEHDTATFETFSHTIVVAPTAVMFNDVPVASIDREAKSVAVTVKDGQITLVADGVPVELTR